MSHVNSVRQSLGEKEDSLQQHQLVIEHSDTEIVEDGKIMNDLCTRIP